MTFEEIIGRDKPVLVDFYADWCAPCRMMPPILKDVKSRVKDTADIIKVDVDMNRKVANKYQIQSIPTIMLFKNGEVLWRKAGVVQAKELVNIINKFNEN